MTTQPRHAVSCDGIRDAACLAFYLRCSTPTCHQEVTLCVTADAVRDACAEIAGGQEDGLHPLFQDTLSLTNWSVCDAPAPPPHHDDITAYCPSCTEARSRDDDVEKVAALLAKIGGKGGTHEQQLEQARSFVARFVAEKGKGTPPKHPERPKPERVCEGDE